MSDFSVYTAGEIADWMSQGTVETPPTSLYVTVFDDTDTELDGDLANARAETTTGTDWDIVSTGFENAADIDLGEATTELTNVEDVALFDAATGGNEIARYTIEQAPFNVAEGSNLIFNAGELSFDVVDRTQA